MQRKLPLVAEWVVIGAVRSTTNEEISESRCDVACHRIIIREVQGTPERKLCHFTFQTLVKETFSPSDVSKMFNLDFSERQAEEKSPYVCRGSKVPEDNARRHSST